MSQKIYNKIRTFSNKSTEAELDVPEGYEFAQAVVLGVTADGQTVLYVFVPKKVKDKEK
jgi:hypothetical protein